MNANPIAARKLEANANELANAACTIFLQSQPRSKPVSEDLREEWSHHFRQRVLELSAALATGESSLFTSRVLWSRQAMQARTRNNVPLKNTLHSLRKALTEQFPDEFLNDALSCIDRAITDYREELPEPAVSRLDPAVPHQRMALLYLQSALEGNSVQAMQCVCDAIDDGLSHAEAITRVLLPAQAEVGHLWHIDHITIAEEHLVSTTTQRLMAVIADRAPKMPDRGKTAVTASVSSNAHDIGIRAIAYLMEMSGWRTIYLGADVPRNDIPAAVHFYDADIALLSIALSAQLPKLQKSIAAIRDHCDGDIKILVGGNAFSDAPEVWRSIGADGYTPDALSAVRLAGELVDGVTRH